MRAPSALVNRTHLLVLVSLALPLPVARALDPFTDGSAILNNPELSSGVAIAVADMNGDGLDDIVRLGDTQLLELEFQQPDGTFVHMGPQMIDGSSWGIAIADVDGNGYADIFTGGAYDGLKVLLANDDGSEFELTILSPPSVFVQCVNFADIDNDGALDLFVCNDDGRSSPYAGDGMGGFTFDLGLINPESTLPSDDSGNYGTVWTDYDNDGDIDLYIAKCRLGIEDPLDGRRVNLLFQNDGAGNYVDVAEQAGLRPLAQSWATDFGDVDNDGDFDAFIINHDQQSDLFENLGPGAELGTFADVTAGSGMSDDLDALGLGIQAHFEDFDNDTFIDLLVTGRSGEHRLFINDGDGTFTAEAAPFPTGNLAVQSAAVGDLDDDGFPDVVAGFATGFNQPSNNEDRLFINPGNANNYVNIRLTGVQSNPAAVGARVELNGEWGTQIREVRAGESYGINNSATRHFGLGTAGAIDSIVIRWPSGTVDTAEDPPINTTVHITEGCPDVYHADADGDGFGDPGVMLTSCLLPAGHTIDATDCDDAEVGAFPGNPEVCDGIDNDCNGDIDDAAVVCEAATDTGGADDTKGGIDDTAGDGDTTGVGPASGAASTGDDATGDDAAAGGDGGGCACTASARGGMPHLGLLGLLGLFMGARRRVAAQRRIVTQ